MGTLAISAANLDTLENNMLALNNNINAVTSDIININGQISSFNKDVTDMKKDIKTLEQEIRDFMADIRGTTLVSNAQNDILIKENELNRKYANYDVIRRQISGLLESININLVRKNTLATETEKVLFNAPTYYLSYALIAISAWFNNDKKKANAALNEALKINPKKTSLLLCLVHMHLGRNGTALKWLKKYLGMQNPLELDNDFVILLEAITSGNAEDVFIKTLNKELARYDREIVNNQKIILKVQERWEKFFAKKKVDFKENEYPYIVKFTDGWEFVQERLGNAYSYYDTYEEILNLISNVKIEEDKDLETLLKSCVNNYEDGELNLKKGVLKDKLIIKYNGNIKKVEEEFLESGLAYDTKADFYTVLSNVLLERNDVSTNTKKFAIAALKEVIKNALKKALPYDEGNENITIAINEWVGITSDGANENALKESLHKYIASLFASAYKNANFFDLKIILLIVAALVGLVVTIGIHFLIGLGIIIIALVNLFFFASDILKTREEIQNEYIKVQKKFDITLENILAEIVDVNFTVKRAKDNYDYILEYLDNYEEQNYIKRGV